MAKVFKAGALIVLVLAGASAPASAADLGGSVYTPEPVDTSPPVRLFTWRGFYVGLNGGYAWGSGDPTVISDGINAGTISAIDPSGFLGGGQVGYNAQFGNFVLGAEADIQGGWVDGSAAGVAGLAGPASASSDLNWLSTLRARAGFAADRMLIYATGGVAWADMDLSANVGGTRFSGSDTLTGYAIGGGVEWALDNNWTARAEYLYVDLDNARLTDGLNSATFDNAFHTMRVGINYKF